MKGGGWREVRGGEREWIERTSEVRRYAMPNSATTQQNVSVLSKETKMAAIEDPTPAVAAPDDDPELLPNHLQHLPAWDRGIGTILQLIAPWIDTLVTINGYLCVFCIHS